MLLKTSNQTHDNQPVFLFGVYFILIKSNDTSGGYTISVKINAPCASVLFNNKNSFQAAITQQSDSGPGSL